MRQQRQFRHAFSILRQLGITPSLNAHKLEKTCHVERKTVLPALKLLLKAGHVKSRKVGIFINSGREIREYDVTPQGIVALLQAASDFELRECAKLSAKDIGDIAQTQREFLPLVFGKWDYFIASHQGQSAREFLLMAANDTTSEIRRLEWCVSRNAPPTVEIDIHRHNIYAFLFLKAWAVWGGERAEEWLKTIMADEEILNTAKIEALMFREGAKANMRSLDDCLHILFGKKQLHSVESRLPMIGFEAGEGVELGVQDPLKVLYSTYCERERIRGNKPPPFKDFARLFR